MPMTGYPQLDYTLTVLFSLTRTALVHTASLIQLFAIQYPDAALIALAVLGAYILYYLIKNAVAIIYGLVIAVIKITVVFALLALAAWVYFRGITTFQKDVGLIVAYTSQLHSNTTREQVSTWMDSGKTLWMFYARE